MKRLSFIVSTFLLISIVRPAPAGASTFDGRPKVLLHVRSTTTKNACVSSGLVDPTQTVTAGALYPPNLYFVYLVAARGDLNGVAGFVCGETYDRNGPAGRDNHRGVDVFSWTLCATLELISPIPPWPEPGSGTIITWNTCQTGDVAVAGYFYVGAYGPDTLRVTKRPVDNAGKVADCAFMEHDLEGSEFGTVVFSGGGDVSGCNPCIGDCDEYVIPPPPPPPPPPPLPPPTAAKLMVHVGAPTVKNACAIGPPDACENLVTAGTLATSSSGPFHFLYVLGAPGHPLDENDPADLAGVQFGISYDGDNPDGMENGHGLDVFGWSICATLEFPSAGWPRPGTGNLVTWPQDRCQAGPLAVAGYFYVGAYGTDTFRLIPRPVDGAAKVARCSGREVLLTDSDLGAAAFSAGGTVSGCNPCFTDCADATPVQRTTWSGVKTLFGR